MPLEHVALAQIPQLVAVHAVRAGLRTLQAGDVDSAGLEVDLRPAEPGRLAGAETVAIDGPKHYLVAERVVSPAAGGWTHVSTGSSATLPGGTVQAKIHLDGIISQPTIYLDDEMILENGNFVGEFA